MAEAEVLSCANCGQKSRVRAAASGVPHCPRCSRPLPWLVEVGGAGFAAAVEQSPLPVLVDFWAPWCAPCRMIAPAVAKLATSLAGRLKVAKVNTDLEPALGERFEIRGIPTLVLLEGGRERDRVTGALSGPALEAWVASRLAAPRKAG